MRALALLILIAWSQPINEPVIIDHVDEIELNHFHCGETGRLHFTQWIFWEYDPWLRSGSVKRVVDWKMAHEPAEQLPHEIRVAWWDDEAACRRVVVSQLMYETWTFYDPEIADRETWPKEFRRRLTK